MNGTLGQLPLPEGPWGWTSLTRRPRGCQERTIRVLVGESERFRGRKGSSNAEGGEAHEWLARSRRPGQEGVGHDEKVERWRWIGRLVTGRRYFHLPSVVQHDMSTRVLVGVLVSVRFLGLGHCWLDWDLTCCHSIIVVRAGHCIRRTAEHRNPPQG